MTPETKNHLREVISQCHLTDAEQKKLYEVIDSLEVVEYSSPSSISNSNSGTVWSCRDK